MPLQEVGDATGEAPAVDGVDAESVPRQRGAEEPGSLVRHYGVRLGVRGSLAWRRGEEAQPEATEHPLISKEGREDKVDGAVGSKMAGNEEVNIH